MAQLKTGAPLDNPEGERAILLRITDCAISLGDLKRAQAAYAQAYDLTDPNSLAFAWLLTHRSRMLRAYGDHTGAIREARRSCDIMAQAGDARGLVSASLYLAEAHLAAGEAASAAALARGALSTLDASALTRHKTWAESILGRAQ